MNLSIRLSANYQWAQLGTSLGLYTPEELRTRRSHGHPSDYGQEVLQRWRESRLTFSHLIDGLHELRLHTLAMKIEELVPEYTPVSHADSPLPPYVEKKVRVLTI